MISNLEAIKSEIDDFALKDIISLARIIHGAVSKLKSAP